MRFLSLRTLRAAEVAILGLLGLGIGNAQATIITSGCADVNASCTLDELVSGGSIVINDKLFDNWFIEDFSTLPVDIAGIDVLPLDDQAMNPGVQFNANGRLSTVGFDLIDLDLGFSVATLDGSAGIKDNSLEINGFTFGVGNVGGFIDIFEDIFDPSGVLLGDKFVTADNLSPPILDLFDSAEFPAQSVVFVEKLILVSGDDSGDTVSLDTFSQRFSQVPEPATIALLVMGILGVAITSRRRLSG